MPLIPALGVGVWGKASGSLYEMVLMLMSCFPVFLDLSIKKAMDQLLGKGTSVTPGSLEKEGEHKEGEWN